MTSIVRTDVVEESPERVVMDLRYHYRDETMTADAGRSGTKYGCDGFGERTFTFVRTANGGLEVAAMTGGQRPR
jgi:hypothetical protein